LLGYGPALCRKPFRPHLTVGALSCAAVIGPAMPTSDHRDARSCHARRGITPAFGYGPRLGSVRLDFHQLAPCAARRTLRPPPTPSWPPTTSRWLPVIGVLASRAPQTRGHGGPLQFPRHPSDHSTPPTPEGSLAPAPGSQVPSMAFATGMQARLPLGPLARGFLTTPQASLDAADWPVALRPASTPGSRPTPGPRYRDPGVSPGRTHTGWLP
jgi:hypothetical protein